MTVRELLTEGARALRRHRCVPKDAGRDAGLLLVKASGLSREAFLRQPEKGLAPPLIRTCRRLIKRRLAHEPLDYILGSSWFCDREFAVDRHTLIPRWATESLVSAAVESLKKTAAPAIIDVGTGSGCIAVTLAAELPTAKVIATDVSPAALRLARQNARTHGVDKRIVFRQAELLNEKFLTDNRSKLKAPSSELAIIANLPYLPTRSIAKLSPDIRLYEPRTALDGGPDGLDLYRGLIVGLASMTVPPRFCFFEILPGQYRRLASFMQKKIPAARCARILNPAGFCIGLRTEIAV